MSMCHNMCEIEGEYEDYAYVTILGPQKVGLDPRL